MSGAVNNPNYLVEIISKDATGNDATVVANMSEQFSLEIASDWEATLSGLASSGKVLGAIASVGSIFGVSPYDKILTGQIWRGSQPLEFQLDLKFDAVTNTVTDVSDKVLQLIQWASPIRAEGDWYIRAPGPTIVDLTNRISVRIGQFIYFDNIVIPRLGVTWVTAPDAPGQYIGADVQMTCRTFFTPDRNDIAAFFGAGPGQGSPVLYSPGADVSARYHTLLHGIGLE